MSKSCPKCGAVISDTAKFCGKCGCNVKEYEQKTVDAFCTECGAKRSLGDTFCPECGARYENGEDNTAKVDGFGFSDGFDGWGETLSKFNEVAEAEKMKSFDYMKTPDGEIVVKKFLNEYALKVTVPEGVAVIGNSAFEKMGILSVTLPEGVMTIGKRAFAECKSLESINFPESLIKIDDEAFLGCEKLEIEIPNTVKIVGNNTINSTKTDILKKKSEEEARRKAEEKRKAEEEARKKAAAEAKRKAEEEARRRAEEEARKKEETEAKRKVEEDAKKWQVGGNPTFGTYYQSNSSTKEPIEWEVLAKVGNKALLISKYALDCKAYNETFVNVTWETCTLRKWLNGEFIDSAFNTTERSKIITATINNPNNPKYGTSGGTSTSDKIFLLSTGETKKYFSISEKRNAKPTAFAVQRGAYTYMGLCSWWLRSPGYEQINASNVYIGGGIHYQGNSVNASNYAVRPAFWLNLES